MSTAPVVPFSLRGAWRRRDLSLAGTRFEYQDAWWLQGAVHHLDIRVDLGGPGWSAFYGSTEADEHQIRWHHDVDLGDLPPTDEDVASYRLHGDVLAETGSVDVGDGPVPYVERWDRVESWHEGGVLAHPDTGQGLSISIGSVAAVILAAGDSTGAWIYRRGDRADWEIVAASNPGISSPTVTVGPWAITGPGQISWTNHIEGPS